MTVRILRGDCLDVLRTMPADSVHCVVSSPPYYALRAYLPDGHADKHRELGSEATPDAYIAQMVEVFRLVRRVLRDDGTVWLNLGDSYASTSGSGQCAKPMHTRGTDTWLGAKRGIKATTGTIKPKDLLMMPARVALALQADGWWLRSDIIWHKPNPMPESIGDRPTTAHEHVFLLTKRPTYFYDADAVREPHNDVNRPDGFKGSDGIGLRPYENQGWAGSNTAIAKHRDYNPAGRNLRNVWTIATAPYSDAHFATFPPELAERCIKAGTSERGCCPACGAPWYRVTNKGAVVPKDGWAAKASARDELSDGNNQASNRYRDGHVPGNYEVTTIGWHPTCACDKPGPCVPAVVLDPFGGAGTVGLVADRLQRDAVLIELNPAYAEMAERRLHRDAGMFAMVATA